MLGVRKNIVSFSQSSLELAVDCCRETLSDSYIRPYIAAVTTIDIDLVGLFSFQGLVPLAHTHTHT